MLNASIFNKGETVTLKGCSLLVVSHALGQRDQAGLLSITDAGLTAKDGPFLPRRQ